MAYITKISSGASQHFRDMRYGRIWVGKQGHQDFVSSCVGFCVSYLLPVIHAKCSGLREHTLFISWCLWSRRLGLVYLGLAAGFFTRLQQRCQPALRSHLKAPPGKDLLPGSVHQRTQFLVGCWVKSFVVTCQHTQFLAWKRFPGISS